LVDGTSSENQNGFDGQACAKGAFSAIMVGGFLESYPWVKNKLRNNVPKPKLVKGLIKFFKGLNPSQTLGIANPEGFGVYEFYKKIKGNDLFDTDDAAALFEVGSAEAAAIANKLENNPTLKTKLLNSNAWISIRNSDLTPDLKLKLINDMEESADFAAYFAGQTAEMQEALTSAWKYTDEAYPDKIWCTP